MVRNDPFHSWIHSLMPLTPGSSGGECEKNVHKKMEIFTPCDVIEVINQDVVSYLPLLCS